MIYGKKEKDGRIVILSGGRAGGKASKYSSVITTYGGILYHSKKEAAYAEELDTRVRCKDIRSWERQVRIPLDVNGAHICDYVMDFVITHNDETKEFVEVKGFEKPEWKLKWKLLQAIFPTLRLTLVK